jgi:hypothetical protein
MMWEECWWVSVLGHQPPSRDPPGVARFKLFDEFHEDFAASSHTEYDFGR